VEARTRHKDLESTVSELWRSALGCKDDKLEPERTFFEQGGYSLLAIQLSKRISDELLVDCAPTAILEHNTLGAFCLHLHGLLQTDGPGPSTSPPQKAGGISDIDSPISRNSERFPLTPLQEAYWLGEQQCHELAGPATWFEEYKTHNLDLERLQRALDRLVARHPMLRVVFNDDATQRIVNDVPRLPVHYEDLRSASASEREERLKTWRSKARESSPRLDTWPLLRVSVADCGHVQWVNLSGRLINMDGRSGDVFAADLRAFYEGDRELPDLSLTVPNYLSFVRNQLRTHTQQYRASTEYWTARFDTLPAAPELPRSIQNGRQIAPMRRLAVRLSRTKTQELFANARRFGVTPTAAVCTAFSAVLSRWSGSRHFLLNLMYGNRQPVHPDVNNLVGCLSDTLLLEVRLGGRSFLSDVQTSQKQVFADIAHGSIPGVQVLRQLRAHRGGNGQTILAPIVFASGLGLDPSSQDEADRPFFLEQLGWEPVDSGIQTPHVLLDHQAGLSRGELMLNWDVRSELLPPGLPEAMFSAYVGLIERLCNAPNAWQEGIPELVPESQRVTRQALNCRPVLPCPVTRLHETILHSGRSHPDKLALRDADGAYTYAQLTAWGQHIAFRIAETGVEPGDRVAIRLPKSAAQIAGTLGVLFAGGIYVPLSVDNPTERSRQIIGQGGIAHCLVQPGTTLDIQGVRDIEVPPMQPGATPDWEFSVPRAADSLAYIIFTSGTTGTPKGVAIRHSSALNTLQDVNDRFAVGPEDVCLGVSELGFDLSVYDIFGTFLAGGTLVLPSGVFSKNPIHLAGLLRQNAVTVWNSVPAFMEMLVEYCEHKAQDGLRSLKTALLSGDWIPTTLPARIKALAPDATVVGLGGATEASVWSNYFVIDQVDPSWRSIPYGYPLGGQSFHVLDTELRDAPDWVPGELFIGGRGVAAGYYADRVRTEAQFIERSDGQRLYRTGDWGRYWPDGTLEFLGRRDSQVKIRGHRIELGEIEAALRKQEGVREATVLAADTPTGDKQLLGFAIADDSELDERSILSGLRRCVPGYMVPARVHLVTKLPLTANGKVDRRALLSTQRAPSVSPTPESSEANRPQTRFDEVVREAWTNLLGTIPQPDSDFFQVGGHSITAIRLVNRLERELQLSLPLSLVQEHPTPSALAKAISRQSLEWSPIVPLSSDRDPPPLFAVHPVGGNVFCYWRLASLWPNNVFGVQARGTVAAMTPHTTIEEMAAAYAEAIHARQPVGPVRLLGWSMGGLISLEIAHRLKALGRRSAVVLLDTWKGKQHTTDRTDSAILLEFFHDLTNGESTKRGFDPSGMSVEAALRTGSQMLNEVQTTPGMSVNLLTSLFGVFAANSRAIAAHRAKPATEPCLLLACKRNDMLRFENLSPLALDSHWQAASSAVTCEEVDADHYSIVSEPTLAALVPRITTFYNEHS
jgi:amino acid adenylation domain-containing protein